MMGFGSLDYGGGGGVGGSSSSSSTSNLSPLAPPFTIDSSHLKPKSKPYRLDQFAVEDPYAFSSYSSSHGNNWLHLHPPPTSSLSDSFSNPNLEFDSICAPGLVPSSSSSSYSYGQHNKPYYLDAPSIGNLGGGTNNIMPILSPPAASVSTTSSCFPHVQHSEKAANNFMNEVGLDPYYPQTQYPPAGIGDKKSSPSVVIKKPDGSDILTLSGVAAPFEMSNPVHYIQGYSGLDYTSSWGGFWNRTSEWEEQGSRKEPEGSLGWTEKVVAGSSTNKSLLKEGAPTGDCLTSCGEASGVLLGKSVESLAGKYHIGQRDTDLLNAKCSSSLEENARASLCNMSRQSMFSSSSVFPEDAKMPYREEPYRGSWTPLNANNNSFNRGFSPLDSCIGDPTVFYPSTAFSLGATSKSPTIGKSFSAPKKSSTSANVNFISRVGNVFDNNEDLAGYTTSTSNIKDPLIQLSAERRESIADISSINNEMGRIDPIFMNSSPMRKDIPSNHSPIVDNSWNHVFNRKQEHEVNQFNFCDTSTLTPVDAAATAGAGDPVESSLETFDQFNPAVDSPCWKGAPAFRFSPFAGKEAGTPQLLVKELAGCNGLKIQGPQVFPINDDDTVAISSPEHENSVSNKNAHAGDGNLSSSSPKPSLKVSNRNGVQFSYGSQEPIKGCFLPGVSQCSSNLKPFQMMQLSNEEDTVTFTGQLASECRVADSGIDAKNGSSPVPINAKQHITTSPSSGVDATIDHTELFGEGSDISAKKLAPKVDARLLINAMHNLSELLLASCSNGVDVLEEQDHEILQRVTSNLHSCASVKVGLMRPVPDPHKEVAAGRTQVTREEASVIQSQFDNQTALKGRISSTSCSEEQDMFQDFVSQIGDADFEKDDGMTQRIKKLLKETVDDEEVSLPKIQLYKNLWLEAEAALCSMKYNVRFASMKIEMEKYKLQQEKGKPINVEEQSSSKVPCDQNCFDILSPNIKESLITKISTQEASQSSTTNQEEDVEASLTARLHILKNRSSTNISTQEGSQPSTINQEKDVEDSVMARLQILKCRVDNSSSMCTEGKQPVGSANDGANAEALEKASSPGRLSVRNVGIKTRPTQVVDLGFAGRSKLWPVSRDGSEDGASYVKNIRDVQHQSANYSEGELVLDEDVPEQVMVKEFRACIPDEPIIQSYISERMGKRLPAGGYDSPSSSDWEHVLKDELTWQN
ncbi:hypothetical protein BVC80_8797g20 [Macleaya cordata]|uniref:Uncharacterized protein n=1 Tax=Macleaya cordata TaxID=56857 RepID=A0A200PXT1_MACCD|nr:hypothetical protein BVC80_8797g20 [Macleaya cordata]